MAKLLYLTVAFLIIFFTLPVHAATYVLPTVNTHGRKFMENGHPIVLQGIDQEAGSQGDIGEKLGVNFVRVWASWRRIEPSQGKYDTSVLDKMDKQIAQYQSEGVQVLIDFHQTGNSPPPSWTGYDKSTWWTSSTSVATYTPFVQMMVNRYDQYANVMGFEIWNEPHTVDATHEATQQVIRWQAQVASVIRGIDPHRAIVVMLRGGWDEGLLQADLSAFGDTDHLVLDFHENWGGLAGTGFSANDETLADVCKMTFTCSQPYHGTYASQLRHFQGIFRWRSTLNRPVIVGEWDDLSTDTNGTTYQSQMLNLFKTYNISWARWQGGSQSLMNGSTLTPMGEQIKEWLGAQ